jgi:hypothetical protein
LVTGIAYEIENNSTGTLTVNSSGGNLVGTIPSGVCAHAVCIGTTLTTAADWDWDYISNTSITGTGSAVLANSPTLVTPALGTPASANFTTIAATQAQQETATALTAPVTPGRQQYHPSAAKGWALIGGTTANIIASYNVASTVDVNTGRMTVVWDVDFSSTSYVAVCTVTVGTALTATVTPGNRTAGQLDFYSLNTANSGTDPTEYNVAAFGDQ